MQTDVAIVGGGTAAASAWLTLRQYGCSALLIAPRPSQDDRPGELLSAGADALLHQLGFDGAFAALPQRRANTIYSSWGCALLAQRAAIAGVAGIGHVIDRRAFDAMLQRATDPVYDSVAAARHAGGEWQLTLAGGGTIAARFVIDCSGRSAIVGRTMTALRRVDQMVALCAFLSSHALDVEPTRATLIEAVPGGWWYATLLPDLRISIAFFTDADLLPRRGGYDAHAWHELLGQTRFVHEWLESAGYDAAVKPATVSAATTWLEQPCGAHWAAAGDAAAAFDPLSSYGLVSALWSGRSAASAAFSALNGDGAPLQTYAESLRGAVRSMLDARSQTYAREGRFRGETFWQRRQAESDVRTLEVPAVKTFGLRACANANRSSGRA